MIFSKNLSSQVPFDRSSQVFLSGKYKASFSELNITESGVIDYKRESPINITIDAIGFRKTDNLIYGINLKNELIAIDKNFNVITHKINLTPQLIFRAGDVSPNGKEMIVIGSDPASFGDDELVYINLEKNFELNVIKLNRSTQLTDIAFEPSSSKLYGFDKLTNSIVLLDSNGKPTYLSKITNENTIDGLFFNAFDELKGYGTAVFGLIDAVFSIDKKNGNAMMIASGPPDGVSDAASCSYGVEMKLLTNAQSTLPCDDLLFTYKIANGSELNFSNINFTHKLPNQFKVIEVIKNNFSAPIDTTSIPGTILFKNLLLVNKLDEIILRVYAGDINKGKYRSQATLTNLPQNYGGIVYSDNEISPGFSDTTTITINRYDDDSLYYEWFLCHDKTMILDASEFGSTINWNTGANSPKYEINKGGLYKIEIKTPCEQIIVKHDVASASCPYTIAIGLDIVEDTIFTCDTAIYRIKLINSSGESRKNTSVMIPLPLGFEFVSINNKNYSTVLNSTSPQVISISNIDLKTGIDSFDILVAVGDIKPGIYKTRATLYGLPNVMGPIRFSYDPKNSLSDSSAIFINGSKTGTLLLDTFVCQNDTISLNLSKYGKKFVWKDGNVGITHPVFSSGIYEATINDGCLPYDIIWNVRSGLNIDLSIDSIFSIHQGDSVLLNPLVINEGREIFYLWTDSLSNPITCHNCEMNIVSPYNSTKYLLTVSNEECSEKEFINILVDKSRRLYYPNIISANDDDNNDYFFITSPDFASLNQIKFYDSYGNLIHQKNNFSLNEKVWDGKINGTIVNTGVYIWTCKVTFIDGSVQTFCDDITVIK